ncbi:hypothetical protein PDI74_15585 [Lactiplantibacillus plantarum]|uniref:hypothetical protein n=2 Tax=Lactiplantibacillus plantarum TaxID=1590 RepID=UPI00240D3C54|nr:hypothetical protein [Lactiplantibacillus plantarum]WFB98458.1 hypothetical protein PDI74_15285 [Lactiplantibacillus plantarum]WFB98516.1 hypothetical protein PDI74_15585 [Lactiplantibacillus plantarum]
MSLKAESFGGFFIMDTSNKVEAVIVIGDAVSRLADNQDAIINLQLKLRPKYIPTTLSFAVAAIVSNYNYNESHTMELFITKGTIESLTHAEQSQRIQTTGKKTFNAPLPKDNLRISWSLQNVGFETNGEYSAVLIFDKLVFSTKFYVQADHELQLKENGSQEQ